jgi:hypothetical protein
MACRWRLGVNVSACRVNVDPKINNPRNNRVGFSFLDCPANGLADKSELLINAWLHTPALTNQMYFERDGEFKWQATLVQDLLEAESEVFACLLVAIYVSGSGPPRGTKVAAMAAVNPPNSYLRTRPRWSWAFLPSWLTITRPTVWA